MNKEVLYRQAEGPNPFTLTSDGTATFDQAPSGKIHAAIPHSVRVKLQEIAAKHNVVLITRIHNNNRRMNDPIALSDISGVSDTSADVMFTIARTTPIAANTKMRFHPAKKRA